MKVLHVNDHLDFRGGIETYLLGLLPLQEAAGIEPTAAFGSGDESLARRTIRCPELSVAPLRRGAARLNEFRRRVDALQPDLIHLHNIQNVDAIELCLDSAPVVVTAHDYRYLCPASTFYFKSSGTICQRTCGPACFAVTLKDRCLTPRPKYAWAYYRRVRRFLKRAARFAGAIAPSRAAADRLEQSGFAPRQVNVLPYYCPIEPRSAPRPTPPAPRLLYMGRLSGNKGWDNFIRALGLLPSRVQGTMVGNFNDETRESALQLARQAGCADRLTLRPWAGRDEVREILESSSLLVFPSRWAETLGIIGLEALASGVPVVASDVGGVREWLLPGETGLLTPPNDPAAIAEAASRLLDSPATMEAMGARGIALIREKFLPETHVSRLHEMYEQYVRGGRPMAVTAAAT